MRSRWVFQVGIAFSNQLRFTKFGPAPVSSSAYGMYPRREMSFVCGTVGDLSVLDGCRSSIQLHVRVSSLSGSRYLESAMHDATSSKVSCFVLQLDVRFACMFEGRSVLIVHSRICTVPSKITPLSMRLRCAFPSSHLDYRAWFIGAVVDHFFAQNEAGRTLSFRQEL